jgi:MFS family permease
LFLAIPNFISVFASPLFGMMVDRHGRALMWICIASIMMIISMLLFLANAMGWFFLHPIPLMIWQGTGYALGASAIWPSLSHVVPEKICSTAYGTMTSIQNVGMAIFPMVIGYLQAADGIKGHTLQYTLPILIFIACEVISFALAFLLLGLDKKLTSGRLNATHAERKHMEQRSRLVEQQSQLEAAQTHAREKIERMKKATDEQRQLLVRDISTSRLAYYNRIGLQIKTEPRPAVVFRPSFM